MDSVVRQTLQAVATGKTLSDQAAESFMNLLMEGHISAIQTAGLLAAMSVRGESVDEIVGFARAMKSHSVPIHVPFATVDSCGTGGDGGQTFNISTASAFVAAAAGARVAKHGNRAISSRSGSADVLQALGANIDLDETQTVQCLEHCGIAFLFAPYYHPAMKHAAQTRKELGFRTIFNILGPLTNPLSPRGQVIGVFNANLVPKVAAALEQLDVEHALVVHGDGGIDEFSITGATLVAELHNGSIRQYHVRPQQFGLSPAAMESIAGGSSETNAHLIRDVFAGQKGGARDVVLLNAGAVLYVGGLAPSLEEGVHVAATAIDEGLAAATLDDFVATTCRLGRTEIAQ